uniref:Uncharacterized protein n=1 Tax=Nelumbo nucifera TaxID=4432 RepID=A0A822ZJB1_NELNU|nr:TPA_asm: hypothetical protein HUJ06_001765 [Nelumbo nucifera]
MGWDGMRKCKNLIFQCLVLHGKIEEKLSKTIQRSRRFNLQREDEDKTEISEVQSALIAGECLPLSSTVLPVAADLLPAQADLVTAAEDLFRLLPSAAAGF